MDNSILNIKKIRKKIIYASINQIKYLSLRQDKNTVSIRYHE